MPPEQPLRLLLLGPPGAGKGTQARRLSEEHHVPHVASGDLLREHVRQGTELGEEAKGYMDRGDYVPDELMIEFIVRRLDQPDAEGFVLDGFPRTMPQATALSERLEQLGRPVDLVIALDVPEELIVERLSGRRLCTECQRAYHMAYDPPQDDELCDDCGVALMTRPDDEADTVRHRLRVYAESTAGVRDFYERAGLLTVLDGTGEPEEVAERIDAALAGAVSDANFAPAKRRRRAGEAGT